MLARKILKAPLVAMLSWPAVRRRAMYELRARHYGELQETVPLSHELNCPVVFSDAWHSFSEIFVQRAYDGALELLPVPSRWIDIGCHAGFFSLYIAWRRLRAGLGHAGSALLIDADSRVKDAVTTLIHVNNLTFRFQFAHGAIAGRAANCQFRERPVMASSLADIGDPVGSCVTVPVLPDAEIAARFPPPYDLVKVDIEGSEFDFASGYDRVLDGASALLLEWHAGRSGGHVDDLRAMLARRGFIDLTTGTAGNALLGCPRLMVFAKRSTRSTDDRSS